MILNVTLSPDAEARLLERARACGMTPEEFAQRALEEAVSRRPAASSNGAPQVSGVSLLRERGELSPDEIQRRREALRRLTGSIVTDTPVDDSRESIYGGEEDRGE